MIIEKKKYDLAFVGVGASNSLIINALFEKRILQNLQIAIIEPDSKTKNDKTYCFWATKNELAELYLAPLIDQSWGKIACQKGEAVDISPLRYYHISSIKLYNHVKHLLSLCNVDYYCENLTDIHYQKEDNLLHLITESTIIQSIHVFDSRPPEWEEGKMHQAFLWQSFLGWKIITSTPVFDKEVFTMMDFEVDQSDATQFVYILPYSDKHALVELTRFGVKCIDQEYARKELQKYCREKEWDFTLIEEEHGRIPMCSMDIKQRSLHINHIQTGSAAGKVKPTTGYAFKEMAVDAIKIADKFSMNEPFLKEGVTNLRNGKFAFYDRLLLKILEKNPDKGKMIFTSLFLKVDSKLILKFLEQKTGFREDISVLMSMPKILFIKKALVDCISRIRLLATQFIPILAALLFLFLQFISLESIGLASLLIGLIVLGIPHGAIDHILDKKSNTNLIAFTIKYLLKGFSMFILWKISPSIALLFFLIYTAWHFGQADFIQWKSQSGLVSFIWGGGMLFFLLFSHPKETSFVISQLLHNDWASDYLSLLSSKACMFSLAIMIFSLILNRNLCLAISIVTMLVLSFIPLLEAFGIYFIFQHSLNGWIHIKKRLQKTDLELWRHAFPFTFGALVLFFIFFTSFDVNWKEQLGSFFIFLSCISLPHVLNMDIFYKVRSSK